MYKILLELVKLNQKCMIFFFFLEFWINNKQKKIIIGLNLLIKILKLQFLTRIYGNLI